MLNFYPKNRTAAMKRVDPKGRNWEFGIEHWSIIFVALCSLVPCGSRHTSPTTPQRRRRSVMNLTRFVLTALFFFVSFCSVAGQSIQDAGSLLSLGAKRSVESDFQQA